MEPIPTDALEHLEHPRDRWVPYLLSYLTGVEKAVVFVPVAEEGMPDTFGFTYKSPSGAKRAFALETAQGRDGPLRTATIREDDDLALIVRELESSHPCPVDSVYAEPSIGLIVQVAEKRAFYSEPARPPRRAFPRTYVQFRALMDEGLGAITKRSVDDLPAIWDVRTPRYYDQSTNPAR